jgi:hypothetical protein
MTCRDMALQDSKLIEKLGAVLVDKSSTPVAREAVILALGQIHDAAGILAEPFLVPLLPTILALAGDKVSVGVAVHSIFIVFFCHV